MDKKAKNIRMLNGSIGALIMLIGIFGIIFAVIYDNEWDTVQSQMMVVLYPAIAAILIAIGVFAPFVVDILLDIREALIEKNEIAKATIVTTGKKMIKCPDCGNLIDEDANVCPNCGCPSKEFKK